MPQRNEIPTIPAQLDEEWKTSLGQRFDRQDEALKNLTEKQETLEKGVESVLKLFNDLAGGFRVLEKMGKVAKPIGAIFGALAAVGAWWYTFWGKR